MSETCDVVVVGAGIVGAACARACALAGLQVIVLERGIVSGGTTGTGMGHILVLDDSPAQFALTAYSRQLWQELASSAPAAMEYETCGTLWVAADEQEMGAVEHKHNFYSTHNINTQRLDAQELSREEPHLRPDLVGGLCVPDDAVIYPPVATAFLLEKAKHHKAQVRTHTEVKALKPSGKVLLADGTEIHARAVINATGNDAVELTPDLPVSRRKGHLVITERMPHFAHHQIIELGYLKSAHTLSTESVAFNLQPRQTGQVLLGSSRQLGVDSKDIDFSILGRMLDRAFEYMPDLKDLCALRCWTGFRPTTPDKLPYIGAHPQIDRLWMATGHEGLGITTSLATGQILADLLTDQTPAISPEPYSPARLLSQEPLDV